MQITSRLRGVEEFVTIQTQNFFNEHFVTRGKEVEKVFFGRRNLQTIPKGEGGG